MSTPMRIVARSWLLLVYSLLSLSQLAGVAHAFAPPTTSSAAAVVALRRPQSASSAVADQRTTRNHRKPAQKQQQQPSTISSSRRIAGGGSALALEATREDSSAEAQAASQDYGGDINNRTDTTAPAVNGAALESDSVSASSTNKTELLMADNDGDPEEFVENLREAAAQVGADVKDAALKVGNNLFAALRWGAANALTKSLPPQERDELLERISQNQKPAFLLGEAGTTSANLNEEETELLVKNSVNEAVAAALAEESQREESRWEREKEALLKQAQAAAQKRVESDLAVQKQRLEQEKREMEERAAQALQRMEEERARAMKLKDSEQRRLKKEMFLQMQRLKEEFERKGMEEVALPPAMTQVAAASHNATEVHPILGPALVDLGYKRIHTVSADRLATIPVWKKQRIYRHNRAKAMAQDKLKTLHLGLPGVIVLHEEENGKLSILDGQHRVGMMSILQEKQRQQQKSGTAGPVDEWLDLDHVLVEVYPQTPQVRNIDHAQDIFLEINKAEPVRVIDIPGVATKKDRSIISDAVNNLEASYPTMFSPSQRCRAPNLNVDNLRDSIFAANIIKRHNLKTAKQLLDWLRQQNEALGAKLRNDPEAQSMVNAGAWNKATSNEFYLGLESSWLYN